MTAVPEIKKTNSVQQPTFEVIYKENADMVLNLAYRMTGREELARDITQDVFLKVYQNHDTFREQSKVSTWIYRITLNHIINIMRREKRMKLFSTLEKGFSTSPDYDNMLTVWQENLPPNPEKQLEENEKETIIRAMIDMLDPKYKIPLLLFRYEDMNYKDIAEQLKISISAVESQIHRAKKKLALKLKPWLGSL